ERSGCSPGDLTCKRLERIGWPAMKRVTDRQGCYRHKLPMRNGLLDSYGSSGPFASHQGPPDSCPLTDISCARALKLLTGPLLAPMLKEILGDFAKPFK